MSTARQPKSFKVGCKTSEDDNWVYNSLRFPTLEAADTYARDLFSRWMALKEYEVHESEEEPNR